MRSLSTITPVVAGVALPYAVNAKVKPAPDLTAKQFLYSG